MINIPPLGMAVFTCTPEKKPVKKETELKTTEVKTIEPTTEPVRKRSKKTKSEN